MNEVVIRTEQIGKAYEFGNRRGLVDLRERFSQAIRARLRPRGLTSLEPDGNVWAVRDISFRVRRGEIVGIMGRNGSGKTTLLKMLSGITVPTEGWAEIRGRVATLLDVGAGLHAELTGRENILLNGATHGMSRREIRDVFDRIVEFSELGQSIDQPLKYFSTGMCLRLAFSVAVFQRSSVLAVDEVLAQADPEFQAKCLEAMMGAAKGGQVVLFVSHDLERMRSFCTRGMVFERGRLRCDCAINEAFVHFASEAERPVTPATEFLSEPVAVEG